MRTHEVVMRASESLILDRIKLHYRRRRLVAPGAIDETPGELSENQSCPRVVDQLLKMCLGSRDWASIPQNMPNLWSYWPSLAQT